MTPIETTVPTLRCHGCALIGDYGAPFPIPMRCPNCGSYEVWSLKPFDGDVAILGPGARYYAADNIHDVGHLGPDRLHDGRELNGTLTRKPTRAVVDLGIYPWDGMIGLCFAASVHRPLDGSYISCSGGPIPITSAERLTYAGSTEQRFWHWKDRPRANGGVDYTLTVALWHWDGLNDKGGQA